MPKILIIDDELQIRRLLRLVLKSRGFEVCEAETGMLGLHEIASVRPDAVILDMMLPDMDGLSVLARMREWTDVPVLILSVRDTESLKVSALELGADDYVTKPFSTGELLARTDAILRRRFARQSAMIEAGDLTVDLLQHEARLRGELIRLTPTEFCLLTVLAEYGGRIATQNQIIARVWPGQQFDASQSLRVHITHLRKKLGSFAPRIVSEAGIGYRLAVF
jgi:two-component system KDP operon response regulator KdpE